MGGMITATVLAVFFVPVFFVVVRRLLPAGHVAAHGTSISAPKPPPAAAAAAGEGDKA